jgi:hypothetical protein
MEMRKLMTGATAAALVAMATAAWSLTVEFRLTPKDLSAWQRSFTITTKDVGEFKQFDVTVTPDPKGKVLSPFVRGDLTLSTPNEKVALVRLEPKREGGKVSFWFRVSPQAIAGSRFEIGEQAYGVHQNPDGSADRDEHGQPKFEQYIGGSEYWFLLRDFAGTEAQKP